MNPTLSIAIISKDEEKNIEACIKSVKPIADEIILVDTGSTDKTVELAKNLGAKTYFHKWNNDFSDAKNVALRNCTKDWVLVIDCDERIDKSDFTKIKSLLNHKNIEGYYLRLINYIGDVSINETASLRLFRNRPQYSFQSKLHEQIYFSIVKYKGDKVFNVTDVKLKHYGYDHNIVDMSKKIERNINVLETFSPQERDGFFYFSLGNEYSKLGNDNKAKECFLLSLHTAAPDYGYFPYLAVNLTKLLLTQDSPIKAQEHSHIFLTQMDDFRELYFLKAMCDNALFQYNSSFNCLLKFKELSSITDKYPSFNFENDNDIDGLIKNLDSIRTDHPYGLVSTAIINPKGEYSSIDIFAGVSDISDEVFILDKRVNLSLTRKYTSKSFSSQVMTEDDFIAMVKKECKSAWLLIIKNNTILETIHKRALIPSLSSKSETIINLWNPGDMFIKL